MAIPVPNADEKCLGFKVPLPASGPAPHPPLRCNQRRRTRNARHTDRRNGDFVWIVRPERKHAKLAFPGGTKRRRPHAVTAAGLNQPPANRNGIARHDRERLALRRPA